MKQGKEREKTQKKAINVNKQVNIIPINRKPASCHEGSMKVMKFGTNGYHIANRRPAE